MVLFTKAKHVWQMNLAIIMNYIAFIVAARYSDLSTKFTSTIGQLHIRNCGHFYIKYALNLFPNAGKLFLYIDNKYCLRGLKSENFQRFESITVYIKQGFLKECIKSLNSLLETLKIEKSIAPIVASSSPDLMPIYEIGWKLLKPTSYAKLYEQVGETIQENIVRE